MVVKIRFGKGPKVIHSESKARQVAMTTGALLKPAGAIAFALALWRIAADLNWTNRFAIPSGPFSHWQVWLGAAVLLQLCAHLLDRYGGGNTATP